MTPQSSAEFSKILLLWSVEELERRGSYISSALKVRSINLVLKVAKKPFYVLGMLDLTI